MSSAIAPLAVRATSPPEDDKSVVVGEPTIEEEEEELERLAQPVIFFLAKRQTLPAGSVKTAVGYVFGGELLKTSSDDKAVSLAMTGAGREAETTRRHAKLITCRSVDDLGSRLDDGSLVLVEWHDKTSMRVTIT